MTSNQHTSHIKASVLLPAAHIPLGVFPDDLAAQAAVSCDVASGIHSKIQFTLQRWYCATTLLLSLSWLHKPVLYFRYIPTSFNSTRQFEDRMPHPIAII